MKNILFRVGLCVLTGFLFFSAKSDKKQEAPPEKTVALTFDDGPTVYTPKVLAVLEENSVKATFFMAGRNANRYPEYVRQVYAQGHQIANHTWSHPCLTKLSDQAIIKEMTLTNNRLENIICGNQPCSFHVNYMRPPYGSTSKRVKNVLFGLGYHVIKWNMSSDDWLLIHNGKGSQAIVNRVFSQKRKNHEVVLFHDGGGPRQAVVDALPEIIERYRQLGYRFIRVDEK